ncbi:MAG: hypothetical protein GYA29_00030 [Methanothrix sp.]|nr:hypothetical protein [Methanothrix sp.]
MTSSVLAASAQENAVALNNTTINNTTLNITLNETASALNQTAPALNQTALALNETAPALNETALALNETAPALNETAPALNQTASALNETAPALNETAPALNETALTNVTATGAVLANDIRASTEVSIPQVKPIGSSENAIFVIGTGLKSNEVFQINSDNAKSQKNFEVGITVKPLKDLSKMMFVCNIV